MLEHATNQTLVATANWCNEFICNASMPGRFPQSFMGRITNCQAVLQQYEDFVVTISCALAIHDEDDVHDVGMIRCCMEPEPEGLAI